RRENTITWLGVGNIEAVLLRGSRYVASPREDLFLRPGVVGYRLPPLQAVITPVAPGDLLIVTTDGIRRDYIREFVPDESPSRIGEYILSNFRRENDDGLVLVARFLEPSAS